MKVTLSEDGDLREAESPFRVIAEFTSKFVEVSGPELDTIRRDIVSSINAAHGLDMPNDLSPGIFKILLEALKNCLGWTYRSIDLEVSGSMQHAAKIHASEAEALLAMISKTTHDSDETRI